MVEKSLVERIEDAVHSYEEGYWVVECDFEKRMVPLLIEAKDKLIVFKNALETIKEYVIGGSVVVEHEGEAFKGEGTLLFMIEELCRSTING